MSRFSPSSDEVEKFLLKNGFKFLRQTGSHKRYWGTVNGEKRHVTVTANQRNFDPGTLASMIRQSDLTKTVWQKVISEF